MDGPLARQLPPIVGGAAAALAVIGGAAALEEAGLQLRAVEYDITDDGGQVLTAFYVAAKRIIDPR